MADFLPLCALADDFPIPFRYPRHDLFGECQYQKLKKAKENIQLNVHKHS